MIHNSQTIQKKNKNHQTLFRETEIICFKIKRKRFKNKENMIK